MLAASIPAPVRSRGMQLSVLVPTCVVEISYVQSDLWTGVALAANFVTSRGDEGRFFASDGKDYANTRRVVSQRWMPLGENERSFARLSAIHRYGDVRRITQNYVQADDPWAITGESWHWRPVVPDEEYEYRRGAY